MPNVKVMIVDDDEEARNAYLDYVSCALNCETVAVSDVKSALAAVSAFKPDLVLTDFNMPEASGIDLIKELKAIMPHVSIVMMTSCNKVETAVEAMKLGAEDFLTKPFNFYQLDQMIRRIYEKKSNIKTLDQIESEYIEAVIAQTGSVAEAAKVLGINASTIWRKRKKEGEAA